MENFEDPNLVLPHINPTFLPTMHHNTNSSANVQRRYIYVNQHMVQQQQASKVLVNPKPQCLINPNSKVLINPHFAAKVYVNPNFQSTAAGTDASNTNIHVNPNVLRNIPVSTHKDTQIDVSTSLKSSDKTKELLETTNTVSAIKAQISKLKNESIKSSNLLLRINRQMILQKNIENMKETRDYQNLNNDKLRKSKSIYSIRNIPMPTQNEPLASGSKDTSFKGRKASRTKLICTPVKQFTPKIRRLSVKSQFKIVKSTIRNKATKKSLSCTNMNVFSTTKHKLIKFKNNDISRLNITNNKFKLDNRQRKSSITSPKVKKFIYINQFTTAKELASVIPSKGASKNLSLVNIQGVLYKKSCHSLQRANGSIYKVRKSPLKRQSLNSKYKFVKRSPSGKALENRNSSNILVKQSGISGGKRKMNDKLRKCNIPCPFYRKIGRCKGKDNGKCFRKHDPDQIALCTKFLQGACVNPKCLLSHNVSPEKMPTCKFYLEGICSKDNCPYIHVRLSPKADICRDFLEGFCKIGIKVMRNFLALM
ncbi:unnamed protein product [Acanthoscelides obtectus]|uniref:Zinc finger CCCH domain-containing protein 3 n=1 Tax=Acanthoscelides obtectus TaxID=200917 RepID=A0A9P0NPW2_ACAOB|nr:unnamed protein product [Acanthoscelides obtectus]CAK1639691.1 Zinc finger CCCH domain-containing protein 3 [Acanthoscelides obtectus]